MDDGELVGAEAAELGAVFVDLDAGHDRRGACGAEPVAQPAFEGERGRIAGRAPADAEVVAAPRPVDVALEEPAVDLARVLPGADGGEQEREQIVLPSLGAEQLERAPARQRGRAGGRGDGAGRANRLQSAGVPGDVIRVRLLDQHDDGLQAAPVAIDVVVERRPDLEHAIVIGEIGGGAAGGEVDG